MKKCNIYLFFFRSIPSSIFSLTCLFYQNLMIPYGTFVDKLVNLINCSIFFAISNERVPEYKKSGSLGIILGATLSWGIAFTVAGVYSWRNGVRFSDCFPSNSGRDINDEIVMNSLELADHLNIRFRRSSDSLTEEQLLALEEGRSSPSPRTEPVTHTGQDKIESDLGSVFKEFLESMEPQNSQVNQNLAGARSSSEVFGYEQFTDDSTGEIESLFYNPDRSQDDKDSPVPSPSPVQKGVEVQENKGNVLPESGTLKDKGKARSPDNNPDNPDKYYFSKNRRMIRSYKDLINSRTKLLGSGETNHSNSSVDITSASFSYPYEGNRISVEGSSTTIDVVVGTGPVSSQLPFKYTRDFKVQTGEPAELSSLIFRRVDRSRLNSPALRSPVSCTGQGVQTGQIEPCDVPLPLPDSEGL